jgi:tRNA threonylcarbamoyladenosine modification (KEOPS) complex  Pcc1 subunit
MKKYASFIFNFETSFDASLIFKSLSPELEQNIPKTSVELSHHGTILSLNIQSNDLSSLRAVCNSYLRWISTAISVKQLI